MLCKEAQGEQSTLQEIFHEMGGSHEWEMNHEAPNAGQIQQLLLQSKKELALLTRALAAAQKAANSSGLKKEVNLEMEHNGEMEEEAGGLAKTVKSLWHRTQKLRAILQILLRLASKADPQSDIERARAYQVNQQQVQQQRLQQGKTAPKRPPVSGSKELSVMQEIFAQI
jgi:hypothetical protein